MGKLGSCCLLLAMSISLPLAGFLSQRFGKRSIYLIALLGFALASTAGGLFNQFESVLIARALQGFCSGLMIPLSLGLIFQLHQVNNGEVQQDYGVP